MRKNKAYPRFQAKRFAVSGLTTEQIVSILLENSPFEDKNAKETGVWKNALSKELGRRKKLYLIGNFQNESQTAILS